MHAEKESMKASGKNEKKSNTFLSSKNNPVFLESHT